LNKRRILKRIENNGIKANAKSHTHLQFAPANAKAKNCKRVCLCQRYKQNGKKYENTTTYIKNSGFGALTKMNFINLRSVFNRKVSA
jgi:hypothetical protein